MTAAVGDSLKKIGFAFGKSNTCRASAWLSHNQNGELLLDLAVHLQTENQKMPKFINAVLIVGILILGCPCGTGAQERLERISPPQPIRPVHTFSIVARDPKTGELGVAVQSHWFSVGSTVPWAEAGVGAVATQSFVDPSYGPLGLELIRAGRSAPDALKALLAGDEGRDVRQVAMIDSQGRVDAWTGKNDIQAAGHHVGKDYSVQANLMMNDKVWPAMATAFENTKGDLADRMLAALDAAQSVGGDIRGKQSAALIVVTGKPTGLAWKDRIFDLRVDDSETPLRELRRLVTLQRAYNHMNAGDLAVEKKDNEGALREYGAAEKLVPDNAEMIYWHAVALVNMGRVEESFPLFKRVFAMDRNWIELTPRLPKSGLLPNDLKIIERIVAVGK
jgi:uncharacterized Ntn-hydrolase superfamily protein